MKDCAIPILPTRDLEAACDFYAVLGFETLSRHEDYAALRFGDLEIHLVLTLGHDPKSGAGAAYFRVEELAFYDGKWMFEGLKRSQVEAKPWGMREFSVVDPDGNLLRIGERLQ